MTSKLTNFKNAYINYMTRRGQIEVHRVLLNTSDRALKDMGISRELLEGGVSNWPWTAPQEDGFTLSTDKISSVNSGVAAKPAVTNKSKRKNIAAAIKELRGFSDYQLRDLGIHRGMIRDAVINGRPGIDNIVPAQASTEKAIPSKEVIVAAPQVANVGLAKNSANDTDRPQPPMTPPSSGGGSRQAA